MTDDEKVARYHWLRSQQMWHWERRGFGNTWHRRQARWYSRQASAIPGLFQIMVMRAFKKNASKIAANVNKHNAFFRRLRDAPLHNRS